METVNFKVTWNKNPEVHFKGYIDIPAQECEDEDIEWYYYDHQGFITQHKQVLHDGVGIKGATYEQGCEIDSFKNDFLEDSLWIETVIQESTENENKTYIRENCTLIINEGA